MTHAFKADYTLPSVWCSDSHTVQGCSLHNHEDALPLNPHSTDYFFTSEVCGDVWTLPLCRPPQARSQFKSRSTANNVAIMVPVPSDADSPKFKTSTGSAKWVPEKNVVQWNIKSFPVSMEHEAQQK